MVEFDTVNYPGLQAVLDDLEVDWAAAIHYKLLSRGAELYQKAQAEEKIRTYNTDKRFVLCESTDFYKTIIQSFPSYGLTISDDDSTPLYLLIFGDKIPKQFRPIGAAHMSLYADLVSAGFDKGEARKNAVKVEANMARCLGVLEEYVNFLESDFPAKYREMDNLGQLFYEPIDF